MNSSQILEYLKEIKKQLEIFKKIAGKYPSSHSYYGKKFEKLKLEIRAFLLKSKAAGDVQSLFTPILSLETISKNQCEKLIYDLNIKIQDFEVILEDDLIERIYDKGSRFDFHVDIKDILDKAKNEIFIIEPFINEDLIEMTLRKIDVNLNIKILTNSNNSYMRGQFTKVANMFRAKHKGTFETRESQDIHDRGIFIDNSIGWVMGQSIKDAGKKPTYLIKLTNPDKLESIYQIIWNSATKIN